MKKEHIFGFTLVSVGTLVLAAVFTPVDSSHVGNTSLHEIKTADQWNQFRNLRNQAVTPMGQYGGMPVALANAPIISQGEAPPVLVKELGVEIVPVSGGKVKVSGVMGNSWADKAGLERNDIVLKINSQKFSGIKGFKAIVANLPPEQDYRIKIMRHGRTKSFLVTVGEGEMEGFTPIMAVAFANPVEQGLYMFQCRICGQCYTSQNAGGTSGQLCPRCNVPMPLLK